MLLYVRVVECENLKLKFIILNNSSWASCASVDRISVRINENIKRLVLHLHFINLLHRIWKFTASYGGIFKLQIFIIIRFTACGGNFRNEFTALVLNL